MCGITGYVGDKNAPELLFEMLKNLEYRGYDSAGIAYISSGKIEVPKDKGRVSEVMEKIKPSTIKSKIGVGHTRWATHGRPSKLNSHPHKDCEGDFVIAHNGIIENHVDLKKELIEMGHKFRSETDTEVVAHLIEEYYDGDMISSIERTLDKIRGSYALTVLTVHDPEKIFFARHESPMIIGLGDGENFIASDAPAFIKHTRKVIILEDGEYGYISKDKTTIFKDKKEIKKQINEIDWNIDEAEKGGYHHFMLKEIMEEPQALKNALRSMPEIQNNCKKVSDKKRIIFVACGTAYHAGMVGKYILEEFGVPAECYSASEYRYSTVKTITEDCAVIVISQSGETADTLAAIKASKLVGAYVLGVVNVVGSSITRASDDVIYTNSGPEIAVASTKAYIGQTIVNILIAAHIAFERERISKELLNEIVIQSETLPVKIQEILDENDFKGLAERFADQKTFFYIGRTTNFPTALEGALKIKEVAYVHAEGYPAGELKHGPIAVLNEDTVVIALKNGANLSEKIESNIHEAKARNAKVLTVGEEGDIRVPETIDEFTPILNIVPLHLFAYYISILKGLDPDKPRNLAKSVTVE